ncbi:glycerophosphoryl diester phosphodiesterase membrane domain-containing protein [Microbacterium aureliae]
MTAYPAWTPASRPGIIPLHPLPFGTILGRSFTALRQNPRVLLGFALIVQTAAYLLVIVAVGAVGVASFARLETVPPGTDEFDQIAAGSLALTAVTGFVLGLGAGALGVIVQGIVVTEVAHAAVAEKLTLRALWRRVKPVAWRLVGYAMLLAGAVIAVIAAVGALVFAIGVTAPPAAVALTVLLVLAAIPVALWLTTKLLLAPAAIILERATIRAAVVRAWTLVRGRFWSTLGIIVIISMAFGAIAQVVSLPFSFLATGVTTIIAPTGAPDIAAVIGTVVTLVLVQAVTLLIQSVAVVVQSTATAIVYIDCRMRREGLDLDLLAYVERRDAGAPDLADPYLVGIGRALARPPAAPAGYPASPAYGPPAYAPTAYGAPPAYGAPTAYAPPTYGAPPAYAPPTYGTPPAYAPPAYGTPPAYAPPAYGTPPAYAPPAPAPSAEQAAQAAPPAADSDHAPWAAPGAPSSDAPAPPR